jgi:hypothetical protein
MQQPIRPMEVKLVFSTPRKLPRARELPGRVVVLDLAFASEASGDGFGGITLPFIDALGTRLAAWVDHHDHAEHARFRQDSRFVLSTKAEHGACPEMIVPELVARIGTVETIVCHTDFDGLASAAKWMCGGIEPYAGCDADALAIDTRLGTPSEQATTIDRALRARPRDYALFGVVVRHLTSAMTDTSLWVPIREAADQLRPIEEDTRRLAQGFVRLDPGVALVDISGRKARVDKTLLLMLGQSRERIAVVIDNNTINVATRFDSGIDLLEMMGLSGGMPTRISVDRNRLTDLCEALGLRVHEVQSVLNEYVA